MRVLSVALTLLFWSVASAEWYERDAGNSIVKGLGGKLSEGAKIFLRGDEEFEGKNRRWQAWASPGFSAVVDVRAEGDVEETIRYATAHSIPFIAISGTHGSINSLANAQNAIQISLRNLDSISISPDGNFVTVGGGIKAKKLINHLWPRGKQTVTGICECVGLTAVALGGGHGLLQGYYGLLSDQIVSMRVVLADGHAVTVSEEENQELFWAMRGAGHNFGIVTEMVYRVHDIEPGKETWSWEAFTLPATRENVEAVYGIVASQLDTQPKGMMQYGVVMVNPAVSQEPVIWHNVAFHGLLADIRQHTQAYHYLDGVTVSSDEGTYLDIPRWFQIDAEGVVCKIQEFMPGAGIMRFPVDVPAYNVTALALSVEKFVQMTKEAPEFAGSFFLTEQYSSHAVRAADPSKSAYASRQDKLLLAPALTYPSVDPETGERNEELNEKARVYGEAIKQILVDGAKSMGGSHAYVNYAYGGESLEEIYGKENLVRLLKAKKTYDPYNRFGYYAPLMPVEKEDKAHDEL